MNLHGVLNKGQSRLRVRRGAAMVAAVGVAMLGGIAVASTASATADISICHRTANGVGGNAHNGYNAQSVDAHSIVKENGHDSHDQVSNGPGGDIIPAFDYGDGQHYDGKNLGWGQAWLDNGCNAPTSAHLTLVKKVVNKGGGTAKRSDWTLNAAGPTPFHGQISVGRDVTAGDYTLSETGPSGYTASAWDCDNGELSRTSVVAPTVTVGEGDDVTCTITNTFTPDTGSLTLVKVVDNKDGGTAKRLDWTLIAEGPTPFHGKISVTREVVVGDYTLSETGPSGYSASAWDCSKEFSGIAKVTVGKDENVTCTITNTFIPYGQHKARLTLVKSVNNSAGGSALATAWTLDASGGPTPFGAGPTGVHQKVTDGTYTLSESGTPANYSPSLWDCTNTEVNRTTVVIGPNDTEVTCTITNTYNPTELRNPRLTLTKIVNNNAGGTAVREAWTVTATRQQGTPDPEPSGAVLTNGVLSDGLSGPGSVSGTVRKGIYTLSESPTVEPGPALYTAGAWKCEGGSLVGNVLTLKPRDKADCTITNTYTPPPVIPSNPPPPPSTATLTLDKIVTGGGTAVASDWTLTATGSTSFNGAGSASSAVLPGTYTLSESGGPTGYTPSAWACTPVVNNGAQVTLTAGQIETCTITNTFVPTVVPTVVTPDVTPDVTPAAPTVLGEVVTAPPAKVVKGAVVTAAPVVAPAQVTALAFTGAETVPLVLSGLLALLLGAGLVATARRQGRRANN